MRGAAGNDSVDLALVARSLRCHFGSRPVADARVLVSCLSRAERIAVTRHRFYYGETLLCEAAMRNRWSFVAFLLDECHAEVDRRCNTRGDSNITPMCRGTGGRDPKVARLLVEHGADVNAMPDDGCTPVHWACRKGVPAVVRYLVDNGADINVPDIYGETCLMAAMHNHNSSQICNMCELLLRAGASVNAVDNSGDTALHHVLHFTLRWDYGWNRNCDQGIISLLLRHGADASIRNQSGDDVLQLSAMCTDPGILEYLIGQLNPTQQRYADLYALHAARWVHKDREVDHLARAMEFWKKAVSCRTQTLEDDHAAGPNPVYNGAVEAGDVESLEAIADDRDALYMQALICRERILGSSHYETIERLVECGLQYIRRSDTYRRGVELYRYASVSCSPISMHMRRYDNIETHRDFFEVLQEMVEEEEEGTVRFDDVAPIMSAMIKMSKCQSTISRQVPDAKEWILILSHDVIELLCRLQSTEVESLELKEMVLELVQAKCETRFCRNVLHIAFKCADSTHSWSRDDDDQAYIDVPNNAVVEQLLEAGVDVNAVDFVGDTPLHLVLRRQPTAESQRGPWLQVVNMLLRHGAHVDVRNAQGETVADRLPSTVDKLQYTTLQCLAARAIRQHGVTYHNVLPTTMADFVSVH